MQTVQTHVSESDVLTVEKISGMMWEFNEGKVNRDALAVGYSQWKTCRLGIASPGNLVSPSITRSCDLLYGRRATSGVLGCPIRNCKMTMRAHANSPYDHMHWNTIAKCLPAHDLRMPTCNLHATKCCPAANPRADEPNTSLRKLIDELQKGGDGRCSNPHDDYEESSADAIMYWKRINEHYVKEYRSAQEDRDTGGPKTIYVDPATIPEDFGGFEDWNKVVPVYEATNYNALRVADPFVPADFKPRPVAFSHFIADVQQGDIWRTAPRNHNPQHVESHRKRFYEATRAKLAEYQSAPDGTGLIPWQVQPPMASSVSDGDAQER